MRRTFLILLTCVALGLGAQTPSNDVRLTLPQPERPTLDSIVRMFPVLSNESAADINVPVTIEIEVGGGPYIGGQNTDRWTCANFETPFKVRCTTPQLRAGESLPVQIYIGPAAEGHFEVRGSGFWLVGEERFYFYAIPRTARFPRQILVTNANDGGEGSLRAAIVALNDASARAAIPGDVTFAVEGEASPVIVLETPLPAITAQDFRINGAGTVLDGSKLAIGHGLQLTGAGPYEVRNLTLRRFPWDGIAVTRNGSLPVISAIVGNTIEGNGSRGMTFTNAGNADVKGNRIRDNARSGIFALGGSQLAISENTVDGNGASGIFIGPSTYLSVERNRVAGNGHFGIAIDRRAANLTLTDNSIAGNGLPGIDRGLDGFNGYDYDDYDLLNAKIPPPRLRTATYDASTNTTTITGTYFDPADYWGRWTITVYRNDVPGFHADVILGHPHVAAGQFSMKVPGDLRGSYITASGTRYLNLGWSGEYRWPSEISDWLEVQ